MACMQPPLSYPREYSILDSLVDQQTFSRGQVERQTCVGTVIASFINGRLFDQSALSAEVSGRDSRKPLRSPSIAVRAFSSAVTFTTAPFLCSNSFLIVSRSAWR